MRGCRSRAWPSTCRSPTVLFPQLSRLAARRDLDGLRATSGNGIRQIALLLIPAAFATAVLAEPLTRLVYERGEFGAASTDDVAEALFWFSFSLPFSGANLLLTRTFFSLQRPWFPTSLAGMTLIINAGVSAALYSSLGIGGIVIGTAVSTAAMTFAQAYFLQRELHGFEIARTLRAVAAMLAAGALLGVVAYEGWSLLDEALGRSLPAELISVSVALAAGSAVYAAAVFALRIPEARQIAGIVRRRLGRSAS